LTGREVFTAENVVQMIARHLQAVPESPSRLSGFAIPPELDQLILSCLAKRPGDRPASAWEVAERLEACRTDAPWTRDDARRWWETRRSPELTVSLSD
jgi:eukaryotic-like serine/threonine-protein kinase